MRTLALLLVATMGCHGQEELVKAFDPRCFTPCYGGDVANAGKGICKMGTWQCTDADSEPTCVGWVAPQEETCNGQDNNCNGEPDTDVRWCTSICSRGLQECVSGVWGSCSARQPAPEICNGVDDDCNGAIDDIKDAQGRPEPCYSPGNTGLGACRPGTLTCQGTSTICNGEVLPQPEICNNGIDDDCNGKVDDAANCDTPKSLRITASWNFPNDFDIHLLDTQDGGVPDNGFWPNGWNSSPSDCYYGDMTPVWSMNPRENPDLAFDDIYGDVGEQTTLQQMSVHDHYTVGLHLYAWKSDPTLATVNVKVYCDGNMLIDRSLTLNEWQMWRVGRIWYEPGQACHWEELGDGGMTF